MNQKGYSTNLASEFYVISLLYRLGYDASLTLGNKKAVDIAVILEEGKVITIDVKAVAGKMDWLLGNKTPHNASNHYITLLSYENQFSDIARLPRAWVFSSEKLLPFIKLAGNNKTRYVSRAVVVKQATEFESAWHLLKG